MPGELAELLREAEELRRQTHAVPPAAQVPPWFRIEAKTDKPKTAEVWIYDRIGSDWFDEGVTAKSFVKQINALDVQKILLHINSPGGDFFDGAAIYNALVDHPATVTAVVDGLAASAASFIAQAGEVRRMNRATQMMIHDASGIVIGNAADMADFAEVLGKISDSIAGIYAARGGGSVADWRAVMQRETWYTAGEAVEAGLADEAVDEEPAEPPVRNRFDLSIFNFAGRDKAPAPKPPAPPGSPPERSEPVSHALSEEQLVELRKKAGVADDASLEDTLAALPAQEPDDDAAVTDKTKITRPAAKADGTITLDAAAWQEREDRIKRLEAADTKRRREERDHVIDQAVRDGKFPTARKDHWVRLWDADPEGTRQVLDGLAKNVVPVSEVGHAGGASDDFDAELAEFEALLPPESRTIGKGR